MILTSLQDYHELEFSQARTRERLRGPRIRRSPPSPVLDRLDPVRLAPDARPPAAHYKRNPRVGWSRFTVSQLTGYEAKYLIQPESTPVYGPPPAAPTKLDAFHPYLDGRLNAGVWNAQVLRGVRWRAREYLGATRFW